MPPPRFGRLATCGHPRDKEWLMDEIRLFAANTPWFVYLIFAFVLVRAWRYARPRVGRVDRLWVIPAIIGAFSLVTVFRVGHGGLAALAWAGGAAAGLGVGWVSLSHAAIGADHEHRRLTIPADLSFPPLLVLFFALKYYVQYRIVMDPDVERHLGFALGEIAAGAFVAGIFAGKAWALWRKWQAARDTLLPEPA